MQLVADGDSNIAQFHLADRKGEKREFALVELLEFRGEESAGEGPEDAFARTVEIEDPRGELVVDFQTAAQLELRAEGQVSGARTCSCASRQR